MFGQVTRLFFPRLLPLIALCLVTIIAYSCGERVTRLKYKAEISAMREAQAEQERARTEAIAAVEKAAREQMEAALEKGRQLEQELLQKNQELESERSAMTRRIYEVSENARRDCAGLPTDWVRLYNEALGLTASDNCSGDTHIASRSFAGSPHSSGAACAGIQSLTTPEDILAHIRDYGYYCRKLESGYDALITWTEEKGP